MVDKSPIVITVTDVGHLTCEWWTPDAGDIICKLCQDCRGWRTDTRPIDCTAGNPYCG